VAAWAWYEKPKTGNIAKVTEKLTAQIERKEFASNEEIKIDKVEKREEAETKLSEKESSILKQEQKIDQLLAQAEKNITDLQLTAPAGDNAVEKYNEILKLQPDHSKALLGLESVSRKYTDLAQQALKINKIKKAGSYLRLAKSINPDTPEISQAERLLKLKQRQLLISKNASATITNTQKPIKLKSQELLQTQLACKSGCKNKSGDCKKTALPNYCSSHLIQKECERVQNECLRDPQIIITWGEFAADAECRGRYAQCKEASSEKCTTIQNDQFKKCDSLEDQCLKSC
jgi:tetratricopeptide (TPR) repeat protein